MLKQIGGGRRMWVCFVFSYPTSHPGTSISIYNFVLLSPSATHTPIVQLTYYMLSEVIRVLPFLHLNLSQLLAPPLPTPCTTSALSLAGALFNIWS